MRSAPQILADDADSVSRWLEGYFASKADAHAPRLLAAMRYASLNGGKRLRASLVLSSARLAYADAQTKAQTNAQIKEAMQDIIAVAAAVEMMHAYSLIHDDLPAMDNADYRRGVASCHKAFDEATAILAGDALQTEAFSILSHARMGFAPERQLHLIQLLSQASGHAGMAGGQMLDMLAAHNDQTATQIMQMQEMKTGALICASAEMGFWAGGGDDGHIESIRAYAEKLGFAFQIADDLLDQQGTIAHVGKPVGQDDMQGKANLVTGLGAVAAQAQATQLIETACGYLDKFGRAGDELKMLARFAIERTH